MSNAYRQISTYDRLWARASPTDAELLDQLFDGLGLLLSDAGRQFHPLGAQTDAAAAQVRELDGPAARVTAARLPGQVRSGQVRSWVSVRGDLTLYNLSEILFKAHASRAVCTNYTSLHWEGRFTRLTLQYAQAETRLAIRQRIEHPCSLVDKHSHSEELTKELW